VKVVGTDSVPGAGQPWGRSSRFHRPHEKFSNLPAHSDAGGTALWKLPPLWKSTKEAFGDFFLMISTAAWKSLR
jgi:hypothetical protein